MPKVPYKFKTYKAQEYGSYHTYKKKKETRIKEARTIVMMETELPVGAFEGADFIHN